MDEANATVAEKPPIVMPAARPEGLTPDKMVAKYIALRDKVDEIKKRQSADLVSYNLVLGTLEGWLLEALNASGVDSMRAPGGTFYKTSRTSAKVHEWSKTLDYIRENDAWELLEARVSKTAAEAIMADTGLPIPGVDVKREIALNVRRA